MLPRPSLWNSLPLFRPILSTRLWFKGFALEGAGEQKPLPTLGALPLRQGARETTFPQLPKAWERRITCSPLVSEDGGCLPEDTRSPGLCLAQK